MKNNPTSAYICTFGEVLWDLLPTGKVAGGAPMNVAVHLQQLGSKTALISCVGNDKLGSEIKDFLQKKQCSTAWLQTSETQATGVVKVAIAPNGNASYTIVQPIAWDFIELSPELENLVSNSQAFVYGTLACRTLVSKNTLLALLEVAPLKIFDVNFRTPYFSKQEVEPLLQKANIVKMNDDELAIFATWYGIESKSQRQQMESIIDMFGLQLIVVTQGSNGAAVLANNIFHKEAGHLVSVADTIGSGDAFLAGFLKKYLAGNSAQDCLKYACALGSLVATHSGATPEIHETTIQDLLNAATS